MVGVLLGLVPATVRGEPPPRSLRRITHGASRTTGLGELMATTPIGDDAVLRSSPDAAPSRCCLHQICVISINLDLTMRRSYPSPTVSHEPTEDRSHGTPPIPIMSPEPEQRHGARAHCVRALPGSRQWRAGGADDQHCCRRVVVAPVHGRPGPSAIVTVVGIVAHPQADKRPPTDSNTR